MARIITSPEVYYYPWNYHGVFLAGGISGCDDWQAYVCEKLRTSLPNNVVVLNPRRSGTLDPTHEPSAREQISWEYNELNDVDSVIFWFPAGGPNPIALFEFGKELAKAKSSGKDYRLYIGCSPDNARSLDIKIQTELMFPEKYIHSDLDDLINDFISEFENV